MRRELVFFLEEQSAEEMLKGLLPKLLDVEPSHRCIRFEGKQDMGKQLERKLRNWCNPDARFVILQDKDANDCKALKQRLTAICEKAGKPNSLVRIVCHELESWYLGDLQAVEKGLDLDGLSRQQQKSKFRNPDILGNAKQELKALTKNRYQPISGSRAIGRKMSVASNCSRSFQIFVAGILETRRMTNDEPRNP